jgi:predicted acyltransferase
MATPAAHSPASASQTSPPGNGRLVSLDALRGFDMFFIIGGRDLLLAIAGLIASIGSLKTLEATKNCLATVDLEAHHADWHGFTFFDLKDSLHPGYTFYDLVFPLFVFMVGAAIPFSLSKRVERGESLGHVYWKICRRTVLLVLLGLIINGLFKLDFDHLRYPHVLARIGVAYFFAAIITLHTSVRGRVLWIVLILAGYWAAMTYIHVPGVATGRSDEPNAVLANGNVLGGYVDYLLLPRRASREAQNPDEPLRVSPPDPEGILGIIPTIATALLGVLAGGWLRLPNRGGYAKTAGLLLVGVICWTLAKCWDPWLPIQKHLWTSSFVLWTGAWSLFLLGFFYLAIDVWDWKKWAFPFVLIGMNAITIYFLTWIDFRAVGQLLFSHAPVHKALLSDGGRLAMEFLFLYVLYRNRIFLRL